MNTFVIDRFEGEYAVVECENGKMRDIARAVLPKNAKEGDVVLEKDGVYSVDVGETARRREEIQKLQDELFE